MARHEQDREDLMREATALVRRVELKLPGHEATCVVGFRRGGEASIFVGAEPVFQFNRAGELRRGYWNGRLLKAERGQLVQLERRRTESEVQLVRHELAEAQCNEFLQLATGTLNAIRRALTSDELCVLRRFPPDFDVVSGITNWLDSLPQPLLTARTPNVDSG